jgi:hypothetical protein
MPDIVERNTLIERWSAASTEQTKTSRRSFDRMDQPPGGAVEVQRQRETAGSTLYGWIIVLMLDSTAPQIRWSFSISRRLSGTNELRETKLPHSHS